MKTIKFNVLIKRFGANIASWPLLMLILIVSFKAPGDPDLGWHLQNGFYTLKHWTIQAGDVFSWTMPNYPWISHEWLTEIFMSSIYSVTGLWGLTIVFMFVIAGIFWLSTRANYRSTFSNSLMATLIGLTIAWPVIGIRPQMFTLLGLAMLLYVLFAWRRSRRGIFLYSIPVIFAVWVNMHAGFAAGFLLVGVFIVGEIIRSLVIGKAQHKKEEVVSLVGLAKLGGYTYILGSLATLLNPYGWGIYREIIATLNQPEVLGQIAEWLPVDFTAQGSFNLMIGGILTLILLMATRFKVDYTKFLIAVFFFFFSLTSWRHIALFAIACMPFITEQIDVISRKLYDEMSRNWIVPLGLLSIVVLAGWWHIGQSIPVISDANAYATAYHFPKEAVEYIKTHAVGNKMFNEYNWGGYLIWQLPPKKVFIDGRMAIWNDGKIKIFDEFNNIMSGHKSTVLNALAKWDVDFVLVDSKRILNAILSSEREDWDIVYQDAMSSIWVRRDTGDNIQI